MNTSCKATFKNGTTKEFASIEEAAQETGLTIAAIKIRCNKSGCGGKDGTTFEWLDEHTKRSYQAKKSRSKGASWEREVINKLKEIGFSGCVTSRGESKKVDNNKIDIIDTEGKLPNNIKILRLTLLLEMLVLISQNPLWCFGKNLQKVEKTVKAL